MNNGLFKPLPYQKEGVRRIEQFGGCALLADEMGLGKTVQALWWLRRNPDARPVVVVCPASVKSMWAHEAAVHAKLHASVATGREPLAWHSRNPPQLFVINYDILPGWVEYLTALKPRAIVFDESQFLANRTTKRTMAAVALAKGIPHRLALSGTPLTNRPAELWPTLNIIRPDIYDSFWAFGHAFCQPRLNRGKWEYKGATNLSRLHAELKKNVMIRRLKADVLDQLPAKTRRIVRCPLAWPKTGKPAAAEYQRASDDFLGWLRQRRPGRVHRASRAERITRIGYLLRLAAKLKIRAVVDWVNRFLRETDEKLVVFAVHNKILRALENNINAGTVTVSGKTPQRMRGAAIIQFQNDPRTRVFLGNIRAAGTAIDGLQRAASTVAFAELWWVPGVHAQAEDRIHRMGQDSPSWIYYMTATGTIEEKLCQIIQEKQGVIRRTLDGQAVVDDMNVFDQLMRELEQ